MGEEICLLFDFIECFNEETMVKIVTEEGVLIFEGRIGDVTQIDSNKYNVLRESVNNDGSSIVIKVRKTNRYSYVKFI